MLLATMLERALDGVLYDVVRLASSGGLDAAGVFDVVVASGRVPSGVYGRATIRLPAPYASSTTGVVRRHGAVEIVQIPTLAALLDLIDDTLANGE
jgi:hypothetical protein